MRRIIIKETDNTTSSVEKVSSTTNIVYIPGFAGEGATAEVGVPELVTSVADFRTLFGGGGLNNPPRFAKKQLYPCCELSDEPAKQIGFPKKAIPGFFELGDAEDLQVGDEGTVTIGDETYDLTWHKAGVIDPSYTYALGLLSQGLAVVYERMNEVEKFTFTHPAIFDENVKFNDGKPYEGIISDELYKEWTDAIDGTKEVSATVLEQVKEAKAKYDTMVEKYDVSVNAAYKYFKERAFNGVIENIYDDQGKLTKYGSAILNKNEYDVKFITSGGYPAFEYQYSGTEYDTLVELMLDTAAPTGEDTNWGRGDCVVLIDHTDNPHRPLEGKSSVYQSSVYPEDHGVSKGTYGTMFTPWCNCDNGYCMPASYVYLHTFANMVKSNPAWMSVAGVARGVATCVLSLNTDILLTNRVAESYQYGYKNLDSLQCLNAITYVKNYGYTFWGNRTCEKFKAGGTGFATSFLNVRNLISDVKKNIFANAKQLMFEVNNDLLWAKFEDSITPTLDSMVIGYGLKTYTVMKIESSDKTKLSAQIVLYPTYCVESVSVNIDLQDDEVIVAES